MNRPTVALIVTVVGGVIVALIVALLHIGGPSGSSPGGSGSAASSGSSASPAGSASSPVTGQSSVANGTPLGSYSIDLATGSTVSLGSTQPPPSAFSSTGNGDLEKVYSRLQPAGDDQMETLPDGAAPTYQECSTDTDSTGMIIPYVGTSFCLTETSGLIAGGEVTAISSGDFASNVVTIHIFIWRHVG